MPLLLFICIIVLVALLVVKSKQASQKKNAAKIKAKEESFWDMIRKNVTAIILETAGLDFVLAAGTKDVKASLNGYRRLQTGYDELPVYIIAYGGDEMYLTSVKCPSARFMNPDASFILHMTTQNVEKIDAGNRKAAIYLKNKQFIAMSVESRIISGIEQPEESRKFHEYLKAFIEKVNHD